MRTVHSGAIKKKKKHGEVRKPRSGKLSGGGVVKKKSQPTYESLPKVPGRLGMTPRTSLEFGAGGWGGFSLLAPMSR